MLSRLPVEVNPFRLVEQRKNLTGVISQSRMPRLQELLCDNKDEAAEVNATLNFDRTEMGLPCITGEIEAQLDLSCQRCLSKLDYKVVSEVRIILVQTDEQAERAQGEGFDTYLVEDERLFLQDFIEDELLLALPLSAMHEACDADRPYIEGLPEDLAEEEIDDTTDLAEKEEKDNPFAALKNLKDLE